MLCVMLLYLLYYLAIFGYYTLINACSLAFYFLMFLLIRWKLQNTVYTLVIQKMILPIHCLKDILCLQYHNVT